jgi:NADP-dependent aldehyde dehydrogenase
MSVHPIFINGTWQPATSREFFHATNPATGEVLEDAYPVSTWQDLDIALSAAADAAPNLAQTPPAAIADFLNRYAQRIEARAAEITAIAAAETALPLTPRLQNVELPRTTTQLRQAAVAALDGSWSLPTIDTKNNIRSCLAPIGPVLIMGPNNFPFAYNAISGGDFAAALAVGNPIIAKAHPLQPNTTRLLAEEAVAALAETPLPKSAIQLIYHMSPDTGLRAAADPRLAALSFTGSRRAGLALKAAADKAGKPIYLEMSSLNPVIILPGALTERLEKIADEFTDSALAANGQFCTNPGLTLLLACPQTATFINAVKKRFQSRTPGTLLSEGVANALRDSITTLSNAGATLLTPIPYPLSPHSCVHPNTLLHVTAAQFLANAEALQTEAFGNASLFVTADTPGQLAEILATLEGHLTGCIYSDTRGSDETLYTPFAALLRPKVGRFLNDKMPTGVTVCPAMNHGGPYPATGHPGFTAVGAPATLRRFAMLQCFDHVRPQRLPPILANKNLTGKTWRLIDGAFTQADVPE